MNELSSYYDTIVLQDEDLHAQLAALFELEHNQPHLLTIDVEAVLTIVMSDVNDLVEKSTEDLMSLTRAVVLEAMDLKLPLEETDAQEVIGLMAGAFASYIQMVVRSLEELGFIDHGTPDFPFALKRVLLNNDLIFTRPRDRS